MNHLSLRLIKCTVALAIVLLLDASRSEAAFNATVYFIDASGGATNGQTLYSKTITGFASAVDDGGGDLLGSVKYGGYQVTVSGYTLQSSNMSLLSQTTTDVTRTDPGTNLTVKVITYDDTFTAPSSGTPVILANAFAGSNLTEGTATSYGILAKSNWASEVDTLSATFQGVGLTSYSDSTASTLTTIPSSPFLLGNSLVIQGLDSSGDSASLTATTTVTAVPVPPAFALLLSGLPVGSLVYLRRRKKA